MQHRFLATQLALGEYQHIIIDSLRSSNRQCAQILAKKDTIIAKLEAMITHQSSIQANNTSQIAALRLMLNKQGKQLKKSKLKCWLFVGGTLVVTSILASQ